MIIRSNNPYFLLNRAACEDNRLSYTAIGLHTYLMSKPDNIGISEVDLESIHTDDVNLIRSAIDELLRLGYMHRTQFIKNGNVVYYEASIFETPDDNPYFDGIVIQKGETIPFTIVNIDEIQVQYE